MQQLSRFYMQQKMQKQGDLATDNTDNSSTVEKNDIGDQPFINKIIQSTEQIINSQAIKIFQLNNLIKSLKSENQLLRNKYQILLKTFGTESIKNIDSLTQKINQLEQQLVATKTQLALNKAQNLELKFAGMKSKKNIAIPQPQQIVGFLEMDKLKINLVSKLQQFDESINTIQWTKIIQNCLSGYPKIDKFKEKTFDLVKKGIPNQLRASLWPLTFENRLGITDTLYTELLRRKQRDEDYSKRVLSQINKDICRSFNGKTQFDSKIGLATEVTQILQVFHIFRPDVSYVQGMTYPAIVLNLIVGKYKAFNIFCNLIIGNQFFRKLYTFQQSYLSSYCRAFQLLLEDKNQKLSKVLLQRNIQSQIYLVEWFYTFFSRGLSYQFTLTIWDMLAYEQQLLFFKLGLSIFQLLENYIMEVEGEQTITVIRQFSTYITEQKLQQTLFNQKLSSQKMQKAIQKVFKKIPKTQ